jgi:hypothetical protein
MWQPQGADFPFSTMLISERWMMSRHHISKRRVLCAGLCVFACALLGETQRRISDQTPNFEFPLLSPEVTQIQTTIYFYIGDPSARLTADLASDTGTVAPEITGTLMKLLTGSGDDSVTIAFVADLVNAGADPQEADQLASAILGLFADENGISLMRYLRAVKAWNQYWRNASAKHVMNYLLSSKSSPGIVMLKVLDNVLRPKKK